MQRGAIRFDYGWHRGTEHDWDLKRLMESKKRARKLHSCRTVSKMEDQSKPIQSQTRLWPEDRSRILSKNSIKEPQQQPQCATQQWSTSGNTCEGTGGAHARGSQGRWELVASIGAPWWKTGLHKDESIDLTWDGVQLQAGSLLIKRHPDDFKATRLRWKLDRKREIGTKGG